MHQRYFEEIGQTRVPRTLHRTESLSRPSSGVIRDSDKLGVSVRGARCSFKMSWQRLRAHDCASRHHHDARPAIAALTPKYTSMPPRRVHSLSSTVFETRGRLESSSGLVLAFELVSVRGAVRGKGTFSVPRVRTQERGSSDDVRTNKRSGLVS